MSLVSGGDRERDRDSDPCLPDLVQGSTSASSSLLSDTQRTLIRKFTQDRMNIGEDKRVEILPFLKAEDRGSIVVSFLQESLEGICFGER